MERKFVFVGENRSKTAKDNDWSWEKCQQERRPRLCARQLFSALENCGVDPYRVTFVNLFDDEKSKPIENVVMKVRQMSNEGCLIVGMGNKVRQELQKREIDHIPIAHPAARGKLRKPGVYQEHIKTQLLEMSDK